MNLRSEFEFSEFEQEIEELLTRLYDPTYHPPHSLCLGIGFHEQLPLESIRQVVVKSVEMLKPSADVPETARVRRIYDLLYWRYLREETQKATALRLSLTTRHLRREQQVAIHLLAERMWSPRTLSAEVPSEDAPNPIQRQISKPDMDDRHQSQDEMAPDNMDWREQVHRELQALQRQAPCMVAPVDTALASIAELAESLTDGTLLVLDVQTRPTGLSVAMHPAVLLQLLIAAIDKLKQALDAPNIIHLSAARPENQPDSKHMEILLTVKPPRPVEVEVPESDFIQELLAAQDGEFWVQHQGNYIEMGFHLPIAGRIEVLVVDDNLDLVHFYRRYTDGTVFAIEHLAQGQGLLEQIHTTPPDLIVLDVMLPDVDGWDLLRRLRTHPDTSTIPVIVCSVVRRKELAKTLGATLHLNKPVHRLDFLNALEIAVASVTKSSFVPYV